MKDYTEEFLKAVADRLSSRADCKQVEYVVYIGVIDTSDTLDVKGAASNTVYFYPRRSVFPNTHRRRKVDLRDIVDHVMRSKFTDTVYSHDNEYGHACFKSGTLTPGIYQYTLSFDKKRRKWIRKSL